MLTFLAKKCWLQAVVDCRLRRQSPTEGKSLSAKEMLHTLNVWNDNIGWYKILTVYYFQNTLKKIIVEDSISIICQEESFRHKVLLLKAPSSIKFSGLHLKLIANFMVKLLFSTRDTQEYWHSTWSLVFTVSQLWQLKEPLLNKAWILNSSIWSNFHFQNIFLRN